MYYRNENTMIDVSLNETLLHNPNDAIKTGSKHDKQKITCVWYNIIYNTSDTGKSNIGLWDGLTRRWIGPVRTRDILRVWNWILMRWICSNWIRWVLRGKVIVTCCSVTSSKFDVF